MIVPDHWAEARCQHRAAGKQVTIRRYGWSELSEIDAQAKAQARADDALQRVLAGEKLIRREPKLAYNGADGVPIREEVLARHGEHVITRNAYGAHCLNSPNALFADIDFTTEKSATSVFLTFAVLAALTIPVGTYYKSWGVSLTLLLVSLVVAGSMAELVIRLIAKARGGQERTAQRRLADFVAQNPTWGIRVYRTPAGLRLLVTHQTFEATSTEVQRFFKAVSADPMYIRMCTNQRCFRARLTAKPWRIGIAAHMRPRPGIWPVRAQHMAVRNAWIANYETKAADFAACRFIGSLGSGIVHASIAPVIDLHDSASGALADSMPLA